MDVLDGVVIVGGEWPVLGVNLGRSVVANGNLVVRERRALPNLLWWGGDLLDIPTDTVTTSFLWCCLMHARKCWFRYE